MTRRFAVMGTRGDAQPLAWWGVIALAVLSLLSGSIVARGQDARVEKAVEQVHAVAKQGPFQPNWDSLKAYQVPEWYQDAKFGIFIHWGVYSVPAFDNEWYPRNMYLVDNPVYQHHVETYGPQSKFGYKDFIPMFKAENFDADRWADLFRRAGAKYVVPVAEHHDGFAMFDYDFTDWSAAKMGPKRDIVGALATAVRKQGLHFGASSHRAEHCWFYDGGMNFDSDVRDPHCSGLYWPAQSDKTQPDQAFLDDWLARATEIVDKYQPEVVWFDWWIEQPSFQEYLQTFAAYYYNRAAQWKRGVAINYKKQAFPEHAAVLDIERGKEADIRPLFWQTDTSVSIKSWGYIEDDTFRSPDSLVHELVDIISKNGCLLLNVGPKPDGTIPQPVANILIDMGKWLKVNGEAVYGTRPWKISGEGPTKVVGGSFKDTEGQPFTSRDFRFTAKGDTLYAIALGWPENGELIVQSLGSASAYTKAKIRNVGLLGSSAKLKWKSTEAGLVVQLPAAKPCDFAYTLRISPVDPASR